MAAGDYHSLALKSDGTVVGWGDNTYQETNVPLAATNAIAIAAGGSQSMALLQNGTVVQWGLTNAPIPGALSNATAIACGANFSMALQSGMVVAWGTNDQGQTDVPAGLSNVVSIAAGYSHMVALKNDGTLETWGSGLLETNHPGLNQVKLIAAGGNHSLAGIFSTYLNYPVNVANDLLLIYNTNSADSLTVLNYYLANRPGVSNANVLGIGYTNFVPYDTNGDITNYTETISPGEFTNNILLPIQSWLSINPTKRPQYVILFLDVPSRVNTNTDFPIGEAYPAPGPGTYASVQFQIHTNWAGAGWQPFVTSINMNGVSDCTSYISKLTNFGTGKLIISASSAGYGNTNYVLDGIRHGSGWRGGEDYSFDDYIVSNAVSGLLSGGVSSNAILFFDGTETIVGTNVNNISHPTGISNVTGYICWGSHSSLGPDYAIDNVVEWNGNSGWWVIATIESFNGRVYSDQGCFIKWFSPGAFGGGDYANTPVGAITHVDEPGLPGPTYSATYFGLWASGKSFTVCAWNARDTQYFQAVGDPFVRK